MLASTARVATERGPTYLKQLCEHFAHEGRRHGGQEIEVTFDDHAGFVDFAPVISGSCRLDAREKGVLVLDASGTDQVALERVQRVLSDHVERFGGRDGLTVEWGLASEQPSTN
jgi:hypothetical protein